jgi:hypothetical protein
LAASGCVQRTSFDIGLLENLLLSIFNAGCIVRVLNQVFEALGRPPWRRVKVDTSHRDVVRGRFS